MPGGPQDSHLGHLAVSNSDYEQQLDDKPLEKAEASSHATILERIDHVTWANFTLPMATGGIAILLTGQAHTFNGIMTIAKIIYIFDLIIFVVLTTLISIRFTRNPWKLKTSVTHATEGLLFPAFLLSFPTIIGGMYRFGVPSTGPWLTTVCEVLFWIYVGVTFIVAVLQYLLLFTGRQLTLQSMLPSWTMPAFPIMLSGTIATIIAPGLSETRRMSVLVAGAMFQGLGFWIAILMYSAWIVRLMQSGLPVPALRPGMFIAVGPPSFTSLALIGMSRALPPGHSFFVAHPAAIDTLQTVAAAFAIFIWTLSLWFFSISAVSCIVAIPHMDFHLVWYSFVFPNVGLTLALINIGDQLNSNAITWVGSVMTVLLVITWLFVMVMHVRAIARRDIMWPGKDEDKDQ